MLAKEFSTYINDTVDLREVSNHPVSLNYSEIFKAALLIGQIKDGRILPNNVLNIQAPFFKAAQAGAAFTSFEEIFAAVKNELSLFYNNFQPKSLSDWFSFNDSQNILHNQIKPWGAILPWRARSLKGFNQIILDATKKDNEKDGLTGGIEHGWAYCGPVSEEKLIVEANRISKLICSIRENGYLRHDGPDGDIVATALVSNNNEWRWLVTNGYHRACVVAALGISEVTIKINLVVKESELQFWPHVLNKLYSPEQAQVIFNNLFK